MSALTGLVAGTVFYHKDYFRNAEKRTIDTKYGPATVLIAGPWAYIPRHGLEGERYFPPHMTNHRANFLALKELNVTEVIAVNSCGSLRPSLEPRTIIVPNDYICLAPGPTIFDDARGHITPRLSDRVREKITAAAKKAGVPVVDGGIYWQNPGPRLETRAEIRFQSQYADMVGMTMASEATVAQELGMEYASVCSVDNYAHGLSPSCVSSDDIVANAAANADRIHEIIEALF